MGGKGKTADDATAVRRVAAFSSAEPTVRGVVASDLWDRRAAVSSAALVAEADAALAVPDADGGRFAGAYAAFPAGVVA